jgi:peptidoglycan hydrolase CwlO-like protein
MAFNLAGLAVVAASAAVGCAASYLGFRRTLRRAVSERQQATERQLAELAAALKALEAQVAELSRGPELQAAAAPAEASEAAPLAAIEAAPPAREQVAPEILAVIAAAANAFLGKKVRILSANPLESPHETVSPWCQQGRVFVQASHNLRTRDRG